MSFFGNAVFGGYFGVDKHGRHLGAQGEIKLSLYALVALPEDREAHSFLYWFLVVSARFEIRCKGTAFARKRLLQNMPKCVAKCAKMKSLPLREI